MEQRTRPLLDERGTVFAEYVTLLCLASLGCATAVIALGPRLYELHLVQTAVILVPLPF